MSVSSFKSMNALRAPLLNYTATKKIYNLSLHDALPISPFLLNYVNNAKKAEYYDFKATNATTQQIYCNSLDYYRGMQIATYNDLPVFGSARDVGNIAAGYIAASNNIPWGYARYYGFDALQTSQRYGKLATAYFYPLLHTPEGKGTQAAQLLGYKYYEMYGKK